MKKFARDSNLIVDLGMNNGDDTAYYLKTGARVVAVDANPALCEAAQARFAQEIENGRLITLNVAIGEEGGAAKRPFFVNIDNNHWSSLDHKWATRENSHVREVIVECVPVAQLFATHGVPEYMKVDVEGADEMVLDQLARLDELPFYLSVEDCRFGFRYMSKMAAMGYEGFKILDQSTVPGMSDAGHTFNPGSSGPFGDAIPGAWLKHKDADEHYARTVRDREGNRLAPRTQWWDIHCRGPLS